MTLLQLLCLLHTFLNNYKLSLAVADLDISFTAVCSYVQLLQISMPCPNNLLAVEILFLMKVSLTIHQMWITDGTT
jgi:hypothetical protein